MASRIMKLKKTMINLKSCIILFLAFTSQILADDRPRYDQLLEYKNVLVKEIHPNGIRIMHSYGHKTILFDQIPDDVKEDLGLTEEKAIEYEQKLEKQKATRKINTAVNQLREASRIRISAQIFQVVRGGVLIQEGKIGNGTKETKKVPYKQKVKSGGPTRLNPNRAYTYSYVTKYRNQTKTDYKYFDQLIYVACDTDNLYDGQSIAFDAYSKGTHQYTAVSGVMKTIPRYTTDANEIAKYKE